jgi:hypothetical protein
MPARLVTFDRGGGTVEFDYTLTGATIEFSKSTVELKDGKAFIGVGDGGTQIVCLSDGSVLQEVAQPLVNGLTADKTVTNAVTAYKRTMFMANGEAGVYVAMAPENFDKKGCEVEPLNIVGSIRFDELQSANHVLYRNDMLFVATGLGGLKIVSVATNNDEPDDDDDE